MSNEKDTAFKQLNIWKAVVPVLLGIGVVFYFFWSKFDREAFDQIEWNSFLALCLLLALIVTVLRIFSFMYRVYVLSNNKLKLRQTFNVIMIWEFVSAATPFAAGGTAVAPILLTREGISMAESLKVVLLTIFLDTVFLVTIIPILILALGKSFLFPEIAGANEISATIKNLQGLFFISYGFFVITLIILVYGLFINPRGLKWILLRLFSFRWLKKWKHKASETGDEFIVGSRQLKDKKTKYWVKSMLATISAWFFRFMAANFIILGFNPELQDHVILLARQVVVFTVAMIMPLPGGSGIAEIAFDKFLIEYTEGISAIITPLWRFITYYLVLFVGVAIIPGWLRKHFKKPVIR